MPDHDYDVILNFTGNSATTIQIDPVNSYEVSLTFPDGKTTIDAIGSPVIDLVTDVVLLSGGGAGTAPISPDAGNAIEQRQNGLYVAIPPVIGPLTLSTADW